MRYNLGNCAAPAVRSADLLPDATAAARLAELPLDYPPSMGTAGLREGIEKWTGVDARCVLVTVGASEANELAVSSVVRPGDEVVVIEPGYRQVRGLAAHLGARVRTVVVRPEDGWRLDKDALDRAVGGRTRLISVANPCNPLGTVFSEEEMSAVVAAAERSGAWLLADEVFRGSERLTDSLTPTFAGRYDRAVVVGGLSKAFGLQGLRVGWLAAPPDVLDAARQRHGYTTITNSAISLHLAEKSLQPHLRDVLLKRARTAIRAGCERLEYWVDKSGGLLSLVPPQATAAAFVRYHVDAPSLEVAHAVRREVGALVAVGSHFGGEGHLRIGHTGDGAALDEVMEGIIEVLRRHG
ncbi:aminotransferase class I/II-fold pyridoxal phosphate-dependent enzyme [Streptomyces sp. NPDC093261]|uniref:aminotransferase class I/II-fold pyridoxal phosphate-dependent enzyme n=1 Tax=Streptomyces sp. NPDC093261 TaxID=3366037 RepID=UPI0037F75452